MNGQAKNRRHEPTTLPSGQRAIAVWFQRPGLEGRLSRLGEFIAASAVIAFTLTLMVIVAIAIKCDSSGPLFERRWRSAATGDVRRQSF
jgi:lipopolysaccharide/colanic/teichoic acid biosynthesis glycosyltransferase